MKRIVRLTENDLAKIVRRVINERQYLMEGVPNTTLTSTQGVTIGARTVCSGEDYIKVSFIVKNSGENDAYLPNFPVFKPDNVGNVRPPIFHTPTFNVTIGGKPIWGQADGQNQAKIPKGKSATINMVIRTSLTGPIRDSKSTNTDMKAQGVGLLNAFKGVKSGNITVRYNGSDLVIPVTIGGFLYNFSNVCDAAIDLPKGF